MSDHCCHLSQMAKDGTLPAQDFADAGYVAVNTIHCQPSYVERFECLFCSRAKMIDERPGFIGMKVLKCTDEGEAYLVVSFWESEAAFQGWLDSPEFLDGHKRAFADMKAAKERGEDPPMKSDFKTYTVLTN